MSEMPKKSVNSRPYLKTCELIYQLASQRIGEKYRKWEANNPKYNTQSQFFPEDRKPIFSNIFFKNKKIVRSNKCKKKLFVKMTGNISISFPSKSLVKFNGNQKNLK